MKNNFFKLSILFTLFAFLVASCEVGLGESVDTEKPTVSIEYPQSGVVIRDSFVVSGACDDETGLKKVEVTLTTSKSTDSSSSSSSILLEKKASAKVVTVGTYTTQFTDDTKKAWKIELNTPDENGDYPLADGDYTITVTATDNAGRTSADGININVKIDNTAPLVILTNPSTTIVKKELAKASGFGSEIRLKGTIVDDSINGTYTDSELYFSVFDAENNDKYISRIIKDGLSNDLDLVIGEYSESTTDLSEENEFYKAIYGESVSADIAKKYRKFKITVSDSARPYKGSGTDISNLRGNVSDVYFINSEFYSTLKSVGGTQVLYPILNGTSTLTQTEQAAILEKVKDYARKTDDIQSSDDSSRAATSVYQAPLGTFFLMPKNNPTYEVSSFDAFDATSEEKWQGKTISNSGTITVMANVGLSSTPFPSDYEDVFKLYIFAVDEDGNKKSGAENIELDCEWSQNGDNYIGRAKLSEKTVTVGSKYGIELEGHDQDGLEFYNGTKIYRFAVESGANPPTLSDITYNVPNSGSTVYLKKSDSTGNAVDLVISGKAVSNSGNEEGYVSLYPSINGIKYTDLKQKTKSNTENSWSITIPGKYFAGRSDNSYTVTLFAADEIQNEGTKDINVFYDEEAPEISVNSINSLSSSKTTSGIVTYESAATVKIGSETFAATAGKGYVNDKIKVQGGIADNSSVKSASYKVLSEDKIICEGEITKFSSFEFEVDTTKFKDGTGTTNGKDLVIQIQAYDIAGNVKDYSYKYEDGNNLVIHQFTDYPQITLNNADITVSSEDGVKSDTNLFDTKSNNKISIGASDDNGLDKITVLYKAYSDAGDYKVLKEITGLGGKTTYSASVALEANSAKLDEGFYSIKITAADTKTDSTRQKTYETDSFVICISNSEPQIVFVNPKSNSVEYQKESFTASGTVTGQFKSGSKITRGTGDNKKEIAITESDGIYSWSEEIVCVKKADDGTITYVGLPDYRNSGETEKSGISTKDGVTYTIKYSVEDRFGRETEAEVSFKSDFTPPEVDVKDYDNNAYIGTSLTTLYSFSGTVTEENTLESVEYSLDGGNTWVNVGNQTAFNANVDFKNLTATGDKVTVLFRATDSAGNVSDTTKEKSKRTVTFIGEAPVFSEVKVILSEGSKELTAESGTYYANKKYKITGKVTSAAISGVTCQDENVTLDTTGGTFSITDLEKSKTFEIIATDKAEQKTTCRVSVVYDVSAPTIDITQVTPVVTSTSYTDVQEVLKTYKNGAVNGTIKINGTSNDDDKVSSSRIEVYNAKVEDGNIVADGSVLYSLGTDGTGDENNALSVPNGVTNSANRFQFNLDTTKLTDNKGIVIRVVSCDRAGNESLSNYAVYVSQKTDTPELSFGNGDTSVLDESGISTTKNLFGMGANTLYINVSDDDGVKSVTYTYTADGETKTSEEKTLLTDGTSTTFSTQLDISTLGNGVHGLRFTVTDVNGKTQNFPGEDGNTIKVAYDNDVPEISVLKLGGVNYSPNCFAKQTFTISGNVQDSSGTVTVYLRTKDSSGTVTDTQVCKVTECTTEKEWKEENVTNTSGEISRTYVVKDKYGREKSLEIKYKVDTDAPKFVSDYIYLTGETSGGSKTYVLAGSDGDVYNSANVWFTGTSFSIKGGNGSTSKIPVIEENGFEIKLYQGNKDNLISTIQPSGNNNFSGTIDVGAESSSTVILVAVDEAGNESDELKISVNVDKNAPTIGTKEIYVVDPTKDTAATAITDKAYVNSDNVYIKYSATDDVSGIGKVEIFENSKMQTSLGSSEAAEGVFTVDVSDATKYKSGVYDFYIKVTDNAGNSTSSDLTDFILDRDAPVVKYSSPAAKAEVNKNLTISGTITDSYPPENNAGWKWALKVKENGKTSFADVSGVTFDTTKAVGEFSVSGIDTTKLADGETQFLVVATDAAGNTISEASGAVLTVNVNQDSDRPVINLSTISTAGTTTLSSGAISGTITDDDGIKSIQIFVATKKQTAADITDSDWENASLSASNWSYTYKGSGDSLDGDYKLYFKVTDGAGGIFISSDSDLESSTATQDVSDRLKCPKVQYSGKDTVSSAVSFSIDENPPVIKTFEYRTSADNTTYTDWKAVQQNTIFGGVNYKYVQFRIKAYDNVTAQDDLSVVVKIDTVERKSGDSTIKLNASGTTDTDGYYFFEATAVDFTGFATGSYTLQLSVSDKADKPSTISNGVIVDNTAPTTISRVSPSSSEEVSGDITYKGQVADDSKGNSGIEKMYYVIPVSGITKENIEKIKDSSDTTVAFGEKWVEIDMEGSTVTWEFTVETLNKIYTKSNSDITVSSSYTGYETVTETGSGTGIYSLPVWFKLVDAAGNVGYNSSNSIRYNPNADKPKVTITSPVHNVTDSSGSEAFSYVVMGGTIRFTGTAEDNEGVEAVYLQFDMDGDGEFENGLNSDGTAMEGCPYEATEVVAVLGSTDLKGIKVKGSTSWSYSLNVSKLSGLLYSETNKKTLNVRAVAVDNTSSRSSPAYLVGAFAKTVHISINNDIPAFESAKLYQFNGEYNASTNKTPVKIVDYSDDEYVSGENWYLVGKVSSNAGLSSIECTGSTTAAITIETDASSSSAEPNITAGSEYVLEKTSESGNLKDLTFIIPLGDVSDNWKVRIDVTDNASTGSQKTNYLNYSVNVDNDAPAFTDERTTAETAKYGTVKIYKGTYGSVALDSENKVQNSNGLFTLAGRVSEAGSGYENVIFYFKRTNSSGGDVRVYNPMKAHTVTDGTNPGKENRTDITATTATNGKVYINSDNLPALYLASVTRNTDDLYTIQSDSLKDNSNIRVGGLVKIGGTYRKITKVSSSDGTVTVDSECEITNVIAEFVYGMVIDNTGESLKSDNTVKNDDGDGMCESYAKSGTNYTWDASIDSTNIPDGPIEIHVVAFDKAGNSNHGYAITAVSNNAPRIARVKLATDLNSNGTYESNEEQVFTYLEGDTTVWSETTESSGTEVWNLDTDGWTIKNKLQVTPEFVGGTAPFTWVFSKIAGSDDANNLSSPKENDADGVETGEISANKTAFEIANDKLDSSATYEKQINTYSFSFWDSTEETTSGKDSQWSILNVKLNQNIVDGEKPTAKINPFYWNSKEDNSLYGNSLDNGHIELEADWKKASGYNSDATTGVFDGDPKVSGKVVFTGEAYDNVRLDSVWIKFKSTASAFTFENYRTDSLYGSSGTSNDYVLAAVYDTASNEWKVPTATMETDGWTFEISDETFDQSGHKAQWSLSIDSSKISTVAASDIPLSVMAVEHIEQSGTTTNGLTSDATEYRVDVVPYVTSLGTSLTSIERRNPSVYGRSALGRYPVYYYSKDKNGSVDAESITFSGFNLTGGTVTFEGSATGALSSGTVTLPAGAKSGKVSVTVNGITTLNNQNNNDSIGSYDGSATDKEYSYCYNRQPNGQNNNILTDDIEIAVWELKSKVAIPSESSADAVIMHVNPANGLLGFAFTHAADLVSYPNGQTNSYENWAKDWTSISQNSLEFVYDANGNMFGTHSGTDTASTANKASRYRICSSLWGITSDWKTTSDYNTAYGRYNALRLEYMGYYNGTNNILVPEKIKGSRLATTTSTSGTNLYLLYYDASLDMLKFKAGGTVPTSFNNSNSSYSPYSQSSTKFGDFVDNANTNNDSYNPDYTTISVLTKDTASRYFALGAVPASVSGISNDVALALWYDPNTRNLLYSYLENPLKKAGSRNSSGNVDSNWSTPIKILEGDSDGNCAIEVDSEGHVHIAARTLDEGGSLCYVYLDNYKAEGYTTDNAVMVDGYDSTGTYLTLDIAKNAKDGRTIPYIGYMTSRGYVKYAYLVDTESASSDTVYLPKSGSDSENMATGAWETILVPKKSQIVSNDNSKISIGVYRDMSTDVIKAIPSSISGITESAGTSSGWALGNGTSNAILGYGITIGGNGYAETAQLK